MKSMTGYAKMQCEVEGKRLAIEIKTLNSKQLDVNVKLPFLYRGLDLEIRALLNRLERGKIDFLLTEESNPEANSPLNKDLVRSRFQQLKEMQAELGESLTDQQLLNSIINQPEVWEGAVATELDEAFWPQLKPYVEAAIDQVEAFRCHEGLVLKGDFQKHVDLIEEKLAAIPQYEGERMVTAKERIHRYFAELGVKEVDENRFEQELIYYLEKLDITEEKVRLKKHIDYFRNTMENEESSGKKLGFIAQEMGREINTTGSKANHVEIQKLVVEMKDELEKIKEQLGNIL